MARGPRVYHEERGAGRPILLLHGNVGSHRWYERTMDIPGRRAIAPDMPNFGRSDPLAAPADIDAYADAMLQFMLDMKIDRPIVVGHSLGGAVAVSMAARYANLIGALVLVDSAPPSGLKTPEERYPLVERMRDDRAYLARALAAVVPTLNDPPFFDALVDEATKMAPDAFVGNARALARFDYSGGCGGFEGPVLVLWGRKDTVVSAAMARETAAAFPNARLDILEDVGHSVMVEDPTEFVNRLSRFCRSIA